MKKAASALRQLSKQLDQRRQGTVTGGKAPTVEAVQKRVKAILTGELLDQIIRYDDIVMREGVPDLRFRTDHAALHRLAQERFGKTILFTTNHGQTDEELIQAYRGQATIEDAFAQIKDPHCVAWRPMFHWTDSKIRVHAFYCVLALTLAALLRRELHHRAAETDAPLAATSIPGIMAELAGIKEVAHIFPAESGIKPHLTFSTMTPMQKRFFELLGLGRLKAPLVLQEEG